MASEIDTKNRKAGSDDSQTAFNLNICNAQRDKTSFRAQKVSESADPFASGKLPIQQDRY